MLELLPVSGARRGIGGKLGRKVRAVAWAHAFALSIALIITLAGVNRYGYFGKKLPMAAVDVRPRVPKSRTDVKLVSRPMYPFSVIPGGVESGQELRDTIARDPVAAGHYGDFDVANARVARIDRDELVYVSYRMGDRIFWTSKKVKLAKGETVITDGVREARTRCGNRLSETPSQPTSPLEPATQALEQATRPEVATLLEPPAIDFPPVSPSLPPVFSPAPPAAPPGKPPGVILPPFFPPIGGGGTPPPPSAVNVAEPGSLGLLLAGIAAILTASWVKSERQRRKV